MKTKAILMILILFILMACENQKGINNAKKNSYSPPVRHQTVVVEDKAVETKQEVVVKNTQNKVEESKKTVHKQLKNKMKRSKIKNAKEPEIEMMEMVSDDVLEEPVKTTPLYHNTDEYDFIAENDYQPVRQNPLSTFSIDVDNASYSEVRRYLNMGHLPPSDAVRIEEMINYFDYSYKQPTDKHPFTVYTEVAQAPWNDKHKLVMIGIKGKELDYENIKPGNLVFLIDSSGSMESSDKLGLVKKSFKILLDNLPENSKISIVAYAGSAGIVLKSTPVSDKEKIINALDKLQAGGSTAGGEGIKLAYKIAENNFIKNGNNRVILATDGDFNVGVSSTSEMVRLIKKEKEKDIYLTILGYGMGNYKDGRMEQISNAGNGNYFYIDNFFEAKKVFQKDLLANMFTIAKDVKIQVEFNPATAKAYRLIGYVNRKMENKDFNDDTKDAGELGPGHTVTALYEIVPAVSDEKINGIDELKYQKTQITGNTNELLTLKLRYKPIKSNKSILMKYVVENTEKQWQSASRNFRFASGVAGFGMLLRKSKYKGNTTAELVRKLVHNAKDYNDKYKNEFITLVDKYEGINEN